MQSNVGKVYGRSGQGGREMRDMNNTDAMGTSASGSVTSAQMPAIDAPGRQAHITAPRDQQSPGGLLRPGLHRRLVPLLLVLTVASSLGVAALAYFGGRDSAITTAQTRAVQDVRVLRQLLADQGAGITSQNGQLVIGQDTAQLVLNGDATAVDRVHDATNAYATIYQLQGTSLVSIAGNVPIMDAQGKPLSGKRLLGDALSGPARDALLAGCGATDTPGCHHSYSGVVSLGGASYVAAYVPLYDNGGAFVGALAAAIPLDSVLAPVEQQAVLLVLIGLLLGMITLVGGYWLLDSGARRYFAALNAQLDTVARQAAAVSGLARLQVTQAAQQEQIALQVGEQARSLDTLAHAMEQGYAGLRDSAGDLWAEMSQPGAAPDPARAAAQARHATVIAARVGTGAVQARDLSRHTALLMRQVAAHSRNVSDGGRELDLRTAALQNAIGQAGAALALRLARPRTSHGGRSAAPTGALSAMPSATRDSGTRRPNEGGGALTGVHRALAPQGGQTGQMPRALPSADGGVGQRPLYRPGYSRATGSYPAMPPAALPPRRGTNLPSAQGPFAPHAPNPPGHFPNPPSRAFPTSGAVPNPPSNLPNPASHASYHGAGDTLAWLFNAPQTGEWRAQTGTSPHAAPTSEPAEEQNRPGNRLGLPDLGAHDYSPDWNGDQSE
jgi:hypothetical protein